MYEEHIMVIDARIISGYIINCECKHNFLVSRLGISVECPHCGDLALGTELATRFYEANDDGREGGK